MERPTYRALLQDNPGFRRLWWGEVVSYLGDWMTTIALYVVVRSLTDSAMAITMVLVTKTLPVFFMAPLAGPLVDRFDRRALMVGTDLLRAVLVLGLAASYVLSSLPLLYGSLALMMACTGIFLPAQTAAVPQLVPEKDLAAATALSGGTWSVMLALGSAIGGPIVEYMGVLGALALDVVTFLVSAYLLARLPKLVAKKTQATASTGFVDGLRYVLSRPYVAMLTCMKMMLAVGTGAVAMLPLFGLGVYPFAGPLAVAGLYASRGLGALTGSVGVRKITGDKPHTLRMWLIWGSLVQGGGILLLGAAPTWGVAALAFFAGSIGSGLLWVYSSTLLQYALPDDVRGRVFSMEYGAMTLSAAAIATLSGWMVDQVGWSPFEVATLTGVLVLISTLPFAMAVVWLSRFDQRSDGPMIEESAAL